MRRVSVLAVALVAAMAALTSPDPALPIDAVELDREAVAALTALFDTTPAAREIATSAKGVLVFPHMVRASAIQYGDGSLLVRGRAAAHYHMTGVPVGIQVSVPSFKCALFFMTDAALAHLDDSAGWQVGAGAKVVVLGERAASVQSTTMAAKDDVYAVIFAHGGLMTGLELQDTRITRINP